MVYTVFLFLLLLMGAVKSQVKPVNEDDPETYNEWKTPTSEDYWFRYSDGAVFVGNLFAGKAEFPWVVDIRSIDLDVEQWSIGNLVTLSHVLTSARALQFIIDDQKFQVALDQEEDEGMLLTFEYIGVHINFCANYLWEEYKFNSRLNSLLYADFDVFDNDVKDTGTRYARFLYRHPYWSKNYMMWDVGIIKLSYPIRPLPPVVDHIPIWYDNEKGQVTDVDLSQMEDQRRICYIASFGRSWYNLKDTYITDYKVRYRVYYMEMDACTSRLELMRRTRPETALTFTTYKVTELLGSDADNLMCFRTRAKVGAICDHDRGAPLVCDGRVYGYVARAANWENCNNLLPLPFFVQKGSFLNKYYASIIGHVFVPFFQPKKSSTRRMTASSYLVFISFLLALWSTLSTYLINLQQGSHHLSYQLPIY